MIYDEAIEELEGHLKELRKIQIESINKGTATNHSVKDIGGHIKAINFAIQVCKNHKENPDKVMKHEYYQNKF